MLKENGESKEEYMCQEKDSSVSKGTTPQKAVDSIQRESEKEIFRPTVRHHLSAVQALSAGHMARVAGWYQQQFDRERPVEPNAMSHYHGQVMGAVFLSVGFLESFINETYSDASDGMPSMSYGHLLPAEVSRLGRMWHRGIPRTARYSVLEKYQVALDLLGRPLIQEGCNPFQDAQFVIDLRNALVHWEPETLPLSESHETPQEEMHRLEKKLRGKFPLREVRGNPPPFWPYRCLCAGCAKWAVKSSIALIRRFLYLLGAHPSASAYFDNVELDS